MFTDSSHGGRKQHSGCVINWQFQRNGCFQFYLPLIYQQRRNLSTSQTNLLQHPGSACPDAVTVFLQNFLQGRKCYVGKRVFSLHLNSACSKIIASTLTVDECESWLLDLSNYIYIYVYILDLSNK